MKSLTFLLLLSCVALSMTMDHKPRRADVKNLAARRLVIPPQAKEALKWAVTTIINTVIDCAYSALVGKVSEIPMFKSLPIAKAGDAMKTKLKEVIKKATDGAINGLRRRRQLGFLDAVKGAAGAVKGAAGAVGNAAKAAAGKAAAAAKAAGAAAATAGKAFQAAAMKLDGLTGGKLSDALGNTVCPLLAKAAFHALDKAMLSIGFPFTPPCIQDGINNGCKSGVKLFFNKKRILRRLASLKRELMNF